MTSFLIEMIGAALLVALLVVVVEILTGRLRPTAQRGASSLAIGGGLVAVGVVLAVHGPPNPMAVAPWMDRLLTRHLLEETICFFGGALFLAGGLLWRIAGGDARQRILQLKEQIKETGEQVNTAQEVISSIVRSSVSGVMILDALRDDAGTVVDFACRFMNDEAEQLLGRNGVDLAGKPLLEHIPCLKDEGLFIEAAMVLENRKTFRDERCCTHDGHERWYHIAIVKHGDGIITTFTDVTRRKRTENKLRHAAKHDALTDLPSRAQLMDRLTQAITRRKRLPDYTFAVLSLDFDRFKVINESLGHKVGDQLLISIAERLRTNLRQLDTTVRYEGEHLPARLGGDEFVILLDDIKDTRAAMVAAERLLEELAEPHQIDGHEVISTASIGIVTSDGDYEKPEDILRDADTAMSQAKNLGKARFVIFDEHMHSEAIERLTMEKELRQAAAELKDFRLNYQPIVFLDNSGLKGFEALIRWHHPQKGIVPPLKFIDLAEELGLILPIGEWVLREACRQLRLWQERRPDHPLTMTVNIAKKQLTQPDFVSTVADVVKQARIDPTSLVLEVTESTIMDNLDDLTPVLSALQDFGVRLAMDDFGTGHSSLSFLHLVPMDILKIDRSFINRSGEGRKYDAIIDTIVRLAHNLDMEVVAEGIETADQMVLLHALSCNYGQGYLFSKPLEAADAEQFIDSAYRFRLVA